MLNLFSVAQGDWGTQFGMLIQHISESREGGLAGTTVEEVADLQALYRASKQRFDEDEGFKKRAREAVTELQRGNPSYVQVPTHSSLLPTVVHGQWIPLHAFQKIADSEVPSYLRSSSCVLGHCKLYKAAAESEDGLGAS